MCSVIWLTFIELSIIRFIYLFKGLFYKKMLFWKLFSSDTSKRMYSTIFCHQTFYPSELFEKFEEVRCGRVWKQHKHGIGELRHVFYAWINTGSGQKGSVIVARINTGSGRNRLNRCTDLLQIWCGCFFGGPLPDLFKIKLLPLFLMELLVILWVFSNS